MPYSATTWETGDVITAEKLNNIEAGIIAGQNGTIVYDFTCTLDTSDGTFTVTTDVTVEEVVNAMESGNACVAKIVVQTPGGSVLQFAVFDTKDLTGKVTAKIISGRSIVDSTNSSYFDLSFSTLLGNASNEWSFSNVGYRLEIYKSNA